MTHLIEGSATLKVGGYGNLGEAVQIDVIDVCHVVRNIFEQDQVTILFVCVWEGENNKFDLIQLRKA